MRPTRARLTLVDLMAAIGACALALGIGAWASPGRYEPFLMIIAPLVGILWDRRLGRRGIRGGALGGLAHATICLPIFVLGPVRAGLPSWWPLMYAGATFVCVIFGTLLGVVTWMGAAAMGQPIMPHPSVPS